MTFKETAKRHVASCPTLFSNMGAVMDQLFFTNGNGMDWVNGELVDPFDNGEPLEDLIAQSREEIRTDELKNRLYSDYELKLHLFKLDNLDDFVDGDHSVPFDTSRSGYPICQFAAIMNVPKDVTPDWFEAVRGFISTMRMHYSSAVHGGASWRCKEFAEKQLEWLNKADHNMDIIFAYQNSNVTTDEEAEAWSKDRKKRANASIAKMMDEILAEEKDESGELPSEERLVEAVEEKSLTNIDLAMERAVDHIEKSLGLVVIETLKLMDTATLIKTNDRAFAGALVDGEWEYYDNKIKMDI